MAEPKISAEVSTTQMHHAWPMLGQHLWTTWQTKTGMPKATLYRTCLHPDCHEVEVKDAPNA